MRRNRKNTDNFSSRTHGDRFSFPNHEDPQDGMGDLHMSFPLDEAYDPQDGGYDEMNGDHYDSYEYEDYDNDGYDDGFYEDRMRGHRQSGESKVAPKGGKLSRKEKKRLGMKDQERVKSESGGGRRSEKKNRNKEILVVMYSFIFLFLATIGYFVYFDAVQSKDIITHPGNIHIAKLQDHTLRGRILASDGSELARTDVGADGKETRVYPYGNAFAHVVGTSKINKSGLEASYESQMLLSNDNPLRKIVNDLKNEKNKGDDVVTTLDLSLQQVAYNALGNNQGVVLAIEPSTGKILAMVSKPDYDPNTLAENYNDIISDENNKCLLNQATLGLFTPGSIFKIFTTLEYMREHPDYSAYSYICNGSIYLDGGSGVTQMLACYHQTVHGTQDLAASFANSCNASFAHMGTLLNRTSFNQLCDQMLFNQKLPTSIPHYQSSFHLNSDDSDWMVGATAIGQGNTTMTPLHAAIIVSAIANDGVVMEPYLVDRIQNYSGNTVEKYMPKTYGSIMSSSEAEILTDMMEDVVTSGTATSLSGMGYAIAGKTGTAEVDNYGNNAWFVGFAPADDPEIAVCVLVENASSSSSYAAVPIASQLFSAYVGR